MLTTKATLHKAEMSVSFLPFPMLSLKFGNELKMGAHWKTPLSNPREKGPPVCIHP